MLPLTATLSLGWIDQEFCALNTYIYAPKDDRKHRAAWRELYTDTELGELAALASECRTAGVRMVYGLAPGLDLDPGDAVSNKWSPRSTDNHAPPPTDNDDARRLPRHAG